MDYNLAKRKLPHEFIVKWPGFFCINITNFGLHSLYNVEFDYLI